MGFQTGGGGVTPTVLNGTNYLNAVNNGGGGNGLAELDLIAAGPANTGETSLYFFQSGFAVGLDIVDNLGAFDLFLGNTLDLTHELADAAIHIKQPAGVQTNQLGFFGKTPIGQQAAIAAPSGGSVIDIQARAAIVSLLNLVGAAAGGFGLTA